MGRKMDSVLFFTKNQHIYNKRWTLNVLKKNISRVVAFSFLSGRVKLLKTNCWIKFARIRRGGDDSHCCLNSFLFFCLKHKHQDKKWGPGRANKDTENESQKLPHGHWRAWVCLKTAPNEPTPFQCTHATSPMRDTASPCSC